MSVCMCVCERPALYSCISLTVSAVFDLSLSTVKYSKTRDRQTQEYIYAHLQTDMISVCIMICNCRIYHPS